LNVLAIGALWTAWAGAEDLKVGPGLKLENKPSDWSVALTGYGQLDLVSSRNWEAPEGSDVADGEVDVRRLRLGLEMKWNRLSFEGQVDLRDDVERLKDLWLDFRFAKALRLRVGNQKLPVSAEWLIGSRRTDFVERSLLASNLAPGRDLGALVHGEIGRRAEYRAGVFAGDDREGVDRAGTTVVARIILTPARSLDVGASFSEGQVKAEAEPPGADPRPRGLNGRAASGFEFFGRKFVEGRRRRLGADVSVARGPASFKAEILDVREERLGRGGNLEDLPAVRARGWAVSLTCLLTGEAKKKAVEPRKPLFRGPGAIELGVRYDDLHFDDEGPDSGFSGVGSRSRNLRPAAERALTGGLSWWPVSSLRFMASVVVERFEDPLLAPEPGRSSNYVTLLARFQLELP
jgi:phosphate-selective porin